MGDVSLRPAKPQDEPFLRHLYVSNSSAELLSAGLDAAQAEALAQTQYLARRSQYQDRFPDARDSIIVRGRGPIGRLLVQPYAPMWAIVDVAVLPAYQNRGIGTFVLEKILREVAQAGSAVQLHVRIGSAAQRLYERLGFVVTGDDGVHYQMQCGPFLGRTELESDDGSGIGGEGQ